MSNQLPPTHPLRRASWIWPGNYLYLYNHYAWMRRDFELDTVPANAPAFITADKAYKLYVNGAYVCRGPARGYQAHWPFDEIDLAPFLRQGHNWITVEGYNPGISTFQYLHQTCAGMLFAAQWDDVEILSDDSWIMRRDPSRATRTARYSLQTDFQEHVDAAKSMRAWIVSKTPPGVNADHVAAPGIEAKPFGRPPYLTVEPRGIPLLREELVAPTRVVSLASGRCGRGFADWDNVSWGVVEELLAVAEWRDGSDIASRGRKEWFELELQPAGADEFRAVTLHMPRYVVANLEVEVEGAEGDEILDFQFHEALVAERGALHKPGSACLIAQANRVRPAPGACAHEFFHALGFQVITLVARNLSRPLTVRLRARSIGYPFAMRGGFSCSDEGLERIHAICRRTQQICSLDAYVDTPWREQAQWWGDARVQAQNTFYLDGDARLLKRGILQIAGQDGPEGLTYGHAPTSAHNCVLPDFSLTWILTIRDYYWQTGDIGLFRELRPRVEQVLAYFSANGARSRQGLLRHDTRFWYFGDWADLFKGEVPTLLNLWYLLALRGLVELLEAGEDNAAAEEWRNAAQAHRDLVMRLLFDEREGCFCGGLDQDGRRSMQTSVHDQTMALMLGLAPEAHRGLIDKWLLPYLRGEEVKGAVPSAFWCTYVLEEMIRRGYGREALDFIRAKWSPMLSTGTTWEGFEWDEGGSSASHAWSAHPCVHLVNLLGGVRQTGLAWQRICFAPQFIDGINAAAATVQVPAGEIGATWKREHGKISARLCLPQGVEADVVLPGTSVRLGPGEHELEVKA